MSLSLSLYSTNTNAPHVNTETRPSQGAIPPPDTRGRIRAPLHLGGSNQRRPSLLRRFLEYLKQQVAEGLGHGAVTRRRKVEEVEHVLRTDGAVRVDEVAAHVQELSLAQARQPRAQKVIDGGVLLPQGV